MEKTPSNIFLVNKRKEVNCTRGTNIEFCILKREKTISSERKKIVTANPIPNKDLVIKVIFITFHDSSFLFNLLNLAT